MSIQFQAADQATLLASVDDNDLLLIVSRVDLFPATPDFRVRVGAELMLVTAIAGNILTVVRAVGGTVAAAHTARTSVVFALDASQPPTPPGTITQGVNVGVTGARVFKDNTSNALRFRRLVAGSNTTITEGADSITISSTGGGGGDASFDTASSSLLQIAAQVETDLATPAPLGSTFPLPLNSITTVDAQVTAIQAGGSKAKIWNVRRHFLNYGGTIYPSVQEDVAGPDEINGSITGSVTLGYTGATGQVEVEGSDGVQLLWRLDRQTVRVTAASVVTPVPTLSTPSPSSGATAGGTTVILPGTHLTGASAVSFGGTPATSFTVDSSTQITAVSPAHAAGAVSISVTTPGGSATTSYTYTAAPAFARESLALSVFNKASFSASPWPGTASAGASNTRSLLEGINPPSVGASLGGLASANFDGTNDKLTLDANYDDIAVPNYPGPSAFSGWCLMAVDTTAPRSVGAPYQNEAVISLDGSGAFILCVTDDGVSAACYDNVSYKETTPIPLTPGTPALVQWLADGTDLKCRVNGGAWQSVATSGPIPAAYPVQVAVNYAGTEFFDGRIWELGMSATVISDPDFDGVRADVSYDYGISV